nr:unnamed protein product [Digitaria exilis]
MTKLESKNKEKKTQIEVLARPHWRSRCSSQDPLLLRRSQSPNRACAADAHAPSLQPHTGLRKPPLGRSGHRRSGTVRAQVLPHNACAREQP